MIPSSPMVIFVLSSVLCLSLTTFIALWVEWAHAKACKECWIEEVILTTEEMQCNLVFGQHQCAEWLWLADQQQDADPICLKGKRSYALEQARYKEQLASSLIIKWQPILAHIHKSQLLGHCIIDLLVEHCNNGDLDEAMTINNAVNKELRLVLKDSEGLALSTDDAVYEPTCINLFLFFHCCTNLDQQIVGLSRHIWCMSFNLHPTACLYAHNQPSPCIITVHGFMWSHSTPFHLALSLVFSRQYHDAVIVQNVIPLNMPFWVHLGGQQWPPAC
jgi:hypothetical protein